MDVTVNFPRDTTLQELVAVHRAQLIAAGNADAIDLYYNDVAKSLKNVQMMNALFCEWWGVNWTPGTGDRVAMLERWFGKVLNDDRVHGVRFPLFTTSTTSIGELTDDSAGLICEPSTAAQAGQDDFAGLPQFWCCEVAAEKNSDGSHEIYAVEFIDDIDLVRNGAHLTWVLQKNTFTREYDENGYRVFKMRCRSGGDGYEQWPQGSDRTGRTYAYIGNPKYCAGREGSGTITCATGLPVVNYTSHNAAVSLWRARGSQYSGASGNLLRWQLKMFWLKYAQKGNSATIQGCRSYNYQYTAAVSEQGVQRVLLTTARGANLLVGSIVIVGTANGSSIDRAETSMRSIVDRKRITAIETVTVGGTQYSAVYIDNGGTTFDTVAGTTYISAMPYHSGWNDGVQGYDGSRISPTTGKEPGLIQKTEFMVGCYLIVSDELLQWSQASDGSYTFSVYLCADQTKVTTNGTISADYVEQTDLALTFPSSTASFWQYQEDAAINPDVLWPTKVSTQAGSGTGLRAGFYIVPAASGVRASWCVGNLNNGANAALAARNSNNGPSNANWNGAPGANLVYQNHHYRAVHSFHIGKIL